MPRRYVPKTYNNRRLLRLIIGMGITFALSIVILFLSLFFIFSRYVVDGQIILPWLIDEMPAATASVGDEADDGETPDDEFPDGENPNNEPMGTTPSYTIPPITDNPLVLPSGDDDLNTFIPGANDQDASPDDDEP